MSAQIHPLDVILHKRDGLPLSEAEIQAFVRAVTEKTVTDAQIAAFLMAVYLQGQSGRTRRPHQGHALLRRNLQRRAPSTPSR